MFDADPAFDKSDPDLADAIHGAEFRRRVLERLVVMGMAVAEGMEQKAAHGSEPRHCLGKAFAATSRAVRLTLAMHAETETTLLAMRKGVFALPDPEKAPVARVLRAETAALPGADAPRPVGRVRRLVHDAVREAIDKEVGEAEVAREAREALYERLIESEDFTAFLDLPFGECVDAICAELGLKPNWNRDPGLLGIARSEPAKERSLRGWRPELSKTRRRCETKPTRTDDPNRQDGRRPP